MAMRRILRHLLMHPWRSRRVFSRSALRSIEEAIRVSEQSHSGEIRFAIEAALDLFPLLRGLGARERAVEVFSELRVWDTGQNNGVLIFVLLAEQDVEIVADRGIAARVPAPEWARICREMEAAFRDGRFEEGAVAGIRAVGELLRRYFPSADGGVDELPNRPVVR